MLHTLYPELLNTTKEIYSDCFIPGAPDGSIIMPIEPRSIQPDVYEYIEKNPERYKEIYTFDSRLLKLPNAKLILYGTVKVENDTKKTKLISMACSDKNMCEGHRMRRWVADHIEVDFFGKYKTGRFCEEYEIYDGYRFNVAIENYKDGYYFTEKICNCFATKTIPIYYGSDRITEYFNKDGIIIAESYEDIPKIVEYIRESNGATYEKRMKAILDNYERVKEFKAFEQIYRRMYGED